MQSHTFTLRHTASPYGGWITICLFGIGVFLSLAVQTHDWRPLLIAVPLFGAGGAFMVYINRRYALFWSDDELRLQAAGGQDVVMSVNDITQIERETSIARGRPFRRIAIYSQHGYDVKCIDVSLKHFRVEDIRKLLDLIHRKRPDLQLPQV